MLRVVVSLLSGAVAALSAVSAADATTLSIKLCNYYHTTTDFAFAYRQNGVWFSTGWTHVPTGRCTSAPVVIPANAVYLTYVFPAEQEGLGTTGPHRFAVDDNVAHHFLFRNADRPQPNGTMFAFIPSPTYVGGTAFQATYSMLQDGDTLHWSQ